MAVDVALVLLTFISIWAFVADNGPFHDWAEAHPILGIIALFTTPAIVGLLLF